MKYSLMDGVLHKEIGSKLILIELNDARELYELDAYAAKSLKYLIQGKKVETVIKMIADESKESRDAIEEELNSLIEALLKYNLIEKK